MSSYIKYIGPIKEETITSQDIAINKPTNNMKINNIWKKPPLNSCFNIYDFEYIAKQTMSSLGW